MSEKTLTEILSLLKKIEAKTEALARITISKVKARELLKVNRGNLK